jgi:hypothetical protein
MQVRSSKAEPHQQEISPITSRPMHSPRSPTLFLSSGLCAMSRPPCSHLILSSACDGHYDSQRYTRERRAADSRSCKWTVIGEPYECTQAYSLRVFELEDTKFNIRRLFIFTHLHASAMQNQPASRSSIFYTDLIVAMVDFG